MLADDQRRESRFIVYSAGYAALAALVKFLMEDCCSGHPDIRASLDQSEECCDEPTTSEEEAVA